LAFCPDFVPEFYRTGYMPQALPTDLLLWPWQPSLWHEALSLSVLTAAKAQSLLNPAIREMTAWRRLLLIPFTDLPFVPPVNAGNLAVNHGPFAFWVNLTDRNSDRTILVYISGLRDIHVNSQIWLG
jgi:hypothetical protein